MPNPRHLFMPWLSISSAPLNLVRMTTRMGIMEIHRSLRVGDPAPDFELKDQHGSSVRLSEFLGKKNVVLAFYVLAFTGG